MSSGCRDASVYPAMLHQTSKLFNIAAEMGFNMDLLNIGGGFPGNPEAVLPFEKVVFSFSYLNNTLIGLILVGLV